MNEGAQEALSRRAGDLLGMRGLQNRSQAALKCVLKRIGNGTAPHVSCRPLREIAANQPLLAMRGAMRSRSERYQPRRGRQAHPVLSTVTHPEGRALRLG